MFFFLRKKNLKKKNLPFQQAQLLNAYLDAFLLTRKPQYAEVAKEIITYVCRDLSHEVRCVGNSGLCV